MNILTKMMETGISVSVLISIWWVKVALGKIWSKIRKRWLILPTKFNIIQQIKFDIIHQYSTFLNIIQ